MNQFGMLVKSYDMAMEEYDRFYKIVTQYSRGELYPLEVKREADIVKEKIREAQNLMKQAFLISDECYKDVFTDLVYNVGCLYVLVEDASVHIVGERNYEGSFDIEASNIMCEFRRLGDILKAKP